MTWEMVARYSASDTLPAQGAGHWPIWACTQGRPGLPGSMARRQEKDGAKYFGPYQGSTVVREVLDAARMVFPIRVCAHAINPDRPRRPCVHHQVGQCPAPCAGLVSKEDYRRTIDGVIDFLNGRYAPVLAELKDWKQVQDEETGAVGFVRQDFLVRK